MSLPRPICVRMTASVAALLTGAAALSEPGGAYGDSRFSASESHKVVTVTEGTRQGWEQRTWSVRFGGFGVSVTQRIDPETGFPPERRTWGDSFFGIQGHKERPYFSANWSPWTFLEPRIRPKGDAGVLPASTLFGRCAFAGLVERSAQGIVAETVFEGASGGWLRVRFVGLANRRDRFGTMVSYSPPAGREVESLTYQLVCQPHDYSDRGYWQRQRTVTAPQGSVVLHDKTTASFAPRDGPWVFHNRFAHLTSGTFLTAVSENVRGLAVRGAGSTLVIDCAIQPDAGWAGFVCGDWVGEHWRLRADRLFRGDAPAADRAFFASPGVPTELTQIDTEFAAVDAGLSPDIAQAQARHDEAVSRLRQPRAQDSALSGQALAGLADAAADLRQAVRAARADWVNAKRWPHRQ